MVKKSVNRLRRASIRRHNAKAYRKRVSYRAGGREHLLGMARHAHVSPHLGNAACAVDQKGGAQDAHEAAAVHRLLAPDAIGLEHLLGLVGGKRDSDLVL